MPWRVGGNPAIWHDAAVPECRSPHPTVLVARRQWIGRRRSGHDPQAAKPVERLRHLVDLIVVFAIREAAALIDERFDPWRQGRMREIHVATLHLPSHSPNSFQTSAIDLSFQCRA